MLLGNTPADVPSRVLVESAVVGFADVSQTIPLAVMAAPPLLDILPPDMAVHIPVVAFVVFPVIGIVVNVGLFRFVVTIESIAPYAVIPLLVAYAHTLCAVFAGSPDIAMLNGPD